MIFYFSDTHFGHKNILRFDNRPFADTDTMDAVLIRNWNERVTDNDTVYFLGDFSWRNEADSIAILKKLKGHIRLIRGNHDHNQGKLRSEFESVSAYEEIDDSGRYVVLCHYPIPFYNRQHYGAVMLYGHVHNTREWQYICKWQKELWDDGIPSRLINVGCMTPYMNYTPRTLDELLAENRTPFDMEAQDNSGEEDPE